MEYQVLSWKKISKRMNCWMEIEMEVGFSRMLKRE